MKEKLAGLLLQYLGENNPDLLVILEEADTVHAWTLAKIEDAAHLATEEECMESMTLDLRPSKYLFVKNILEDEFPNDFQRMLDSGVLKFELINMVNACEQVFEEMPLTEESEDDNEIKYAVIGVISDYLQGE